MKKMMIILAALLLLVGCNHTFYPDEFGYHYTDVTPMGIKYRVDGNGINLDSGEIDFYFSEMLNCSGLSFPPEKILIISTDDEASPDHRENTVEGWTWRTEEPGKHLTMIVINSVSDDDRTYQLLSHWFIHAFTGVTLHSDHEAFERCGW